MKFYCPQCGNLMKETKRKTNKCEYCNEEYDPNIFKPIDTQKLMREIKMEENMKQGQIDSAERRALNLFDKWNDVTGYFQKHTGYYYEMQIVIKDAVHCGIQEALNEFEKLDGE